MSEVRVNFSSIIENQVPDFIRTEFPLFHEFLSQYYISLENQGNSLDLLQNIDKYVKIESLTDLVDSTTLTSNVEFFDTEINVNSVFGFPKQYGLLLINDEIVTYTGVVEDQSDFVSGVTITPQSTTVISPRTESLWVGKLLIIKDQNGKIITSTKIVSVDDGVTLTLESNPFETTNFSGYDSSNLYDCEVNGSKFVGCVRGFSGTTSLKQTKIDQLIFSSSEISEHSAEDSVENLNILFLKEFFYKLKKQVAPGFENEEFYGELNERLFVTKLKDFYSSKGTDCSFELLFRGLYGKDVEIIRPRDYVIQASDAQYSITKNLVVKALSGDPLELKNKTLYQDQTSYSPEAQSSITNVEKIIRSGKEYYSISLNYNSYATSLEYKQPSENYDNFIIHPTTKVTENISIGSESISVDSTQGFPESGDLVVDLPNGTQITISYTSKNLSQFFGCSGVTQQIPDGQEIRLDAFVYGYGDNDIVKLQVTGVLSDLEIKNPAYKKSKNNSILIKTLGTNSANSIKANNWFLNISPEYEVKKVKRQLDKSDFTYQITFYDDHIFNVGDFISITSSIGPVGLSTSNIVEYIGKKEVAIRGQGPLDESLKYSIKKNIIKSNSLNYSYINKYNSNVQNVYIDPKDDSIYVASPSLPTYFESPLEVQDRSIKFSGTFNSYELNIGFHGLYTGDSISYYSNDENNRLDLPNGIYFVKRIDESTIKIAKSRENIFTDNFIKVSGSVTDNIFLLADFVQSDLTPKLVEPQNIIRKLANPENTTKDIETKPGPIGIFINGVELYNYKSKDTLYFGSIEKIIPVFGGRDYDVINPPNIKITDSIGFGASAFCSVVGKLERIDIIDGGFNFIETPTILISGGGGSGAKAGAKLIDYVHFSTFNSSSIGVDLGENKIGFGTYHKFKNYESVIYKSNGQKEVTGLTNNSIYYLSVQDEKNVKLYKSFEDSVSGINTITLSGFGEGIHKLESTEKKKKIKSIYVEDGGLEYKNNNIFVSPVGINTFANVLTAKDHGFLSGDIVKYSYDTTPVVGLSTISTYYVTKLDSNSFKLSEVATENIGRDFYFRNKDYVNFTTSGENGEHYFNYEPIEVKIVGKYDISPIGDQPLNIFDPIIQPIFRGEIKSFFIKDGGSSYGSQEILNFIRQPKISFESGLNASIRPIIDKGKIIDVVLQNYGEQYNSPPSLIVTGFSGSGAVLTPILRNGQIVDVKVISSGGGYGPDTIVTVRPSGTDCKIETKIQSWKINLVEKLIQTQKITSDDGVLQKGFSNKDTLQYSHIYAPRKLRLLSNGTRYKDGKLVYNADLQISSGREINSISHSPIIGWSYDGNPIYGPFGFSSAEGGRVKALKSGYETIILPNRPSTDLYPLGFFVEDYVYNKTGDLDEYNGRFCITPDYPNGTYAYFCTINDTFAEEFGQFLGYKKPVFPYVIGNKFKSNPIDFNFLRSSNQNKININEIGWLRNTIPYGLLQDNTKYQYIKSIKNDNNKSSIIKVTSKGSVDSVKVLYGGEDYKVDDKIIFDNENTGGFGALAKVSSIEGKTINSISSNTITLEDIEFVSNRSYDNFVAHSKTPHGLSNGDLISINSKDEYNKTSRIEFNTNILTLSSSIDSPNNTGIVTYFSVSGNLDSQVIRENDVYSIGNEDVKVLNIDLKNSRVRVLRNHNNTVGQSHSTSDLLIENSRRFNLNIGLSTQKYFYNENREYYFNPRESISLGVGIGSDLLLSVIELGTQVSIGTGSTTTLYFNKLEDLLTYNRGGYVDIVDSTNSSFNTNRKKIVSIGASSIQIDFDSSALVGSGVTAYLNIWNSIKVPSKTIYIPNHNLNTGTELLYYSNVGDGEISISNDGITSKTLESGSRVYVAKITDDLIGISTVKVGIGSTGSFVGLTSETKNISTLYFTSLGSGDYHSFRTNYSDTFVGQVNKSFTIITTAEDHQLSPNDSFVLDIRSKKQIDIVLKYNDYHRRVLVNPRSFYNADVNPDNNSIRIKNHSFYSGQKIIYDNTNQSLGFVNNKIYYVVVVDQDTIKLSNKYYQAIGNNPEIVEINSFGIDEFEGTISPINPLIEATKYSTLRFDLSDPSLSYTKNAQNYPAFELNFYTDPRFKNIFKSTSLNNVFDIKTYGIVGRNGFLVLSPNENTPKILYYKLDPVDLKLNLSVKKELIEDSDVLNNNQLNFIDSVYSGRHLVETQTVNTFSFNNSILPEEEVYSPSNSIISYYTNSKTALGKIRTVKIINKGKDYTKIPKIIDIESVNGSDAVLIVDSSTIGSIVSTEIQNIGYDYSSDLTLRPSAVLAKTVKIDNFYTIDNVGITSRGKNYFISPDLIVIDKILNQRITDVKLQYNVFENNVKVIKNSNKLGKIPPLVIPINNPNGIGINSITYDSDNKNVIIGLSTGFSSGEEFPFKIGDRVLIENTSIGINSTGKGYNSENYNYSLFTLTNIDENISGNGLITYNLTDYLLEGEHPGKFDFDTSEGIVIPESQFPIFSVLLKPTSFYDGETVRGEDLEGIIEESDFGSGYLNILTIDDIKVGALIKGDSSGSYGTILEIIPSKDLVYNIASNSIVNNGWKKEVGFLNNNTQRIHDSDYYQYFSYAVKSSVGIDKWDQYVSKLNHTSGFKRFSDLVIENTHDNIGINTNQLEGTFGSIADLHRDVSVNCYYDFDVVRERTLNLSGKIKSSEIIFNNIELQDYIESIGNRVLKIDDISKLFDANPRTTTYVDLDRFNPDVFKYKKYYIYIRNKLISNSEQTAIVSLLANNSNSYLNQYGNLETDFNLGSFDSVLFGNEVILRFYPTYYEYNDYDLSFISYDIKNYIVGMGTTSLGDVVKINNYTNILPVGSSSSVTVAEIDKVYRSSKVLVQIGSATSDAYLIKELTVLHDNSNVEIIEYGDLTTTNIPSSIEFGIFDAHLSGSKLKIDFSPNSSLPDNYKSNSVIVSIANTSLSGVGTINFNVGSINSTYTSISSSPTPTPQVIAQYSSIYDGAYYIVSVEDTTNNNYQVSEVLVLSDQNNTLITEYGVVSTNNSPIGIVSAVVVGSNTQLRFTSIANIDVQVRVFQNSIGILRSSVRGISTLDFNGGRINSGYAEYFNTINDVKTSFELKYKDRPIFAREFNAQDSTIVNTETDIIKIPYHFFSTGEEIEYHYPEIEDTSFNAISIASTTIGAGTTNKLPSTLYAIKVNDIGIRVSASAADALSINPSYLDITGIGTGTHTFISKKQNSKVLLTIDNMIQSPIVATGTTTTLANDVEIIDKLITLWDTSNFFGSDLIQIGDEIIKVESVGVGTTNSIIVYRGWMGSGITTHSANSIVTKVVGNYNIVDSTAHFAEAPYGNMDTIDDYYGISFNSSFSGRAFLRSGIKDSSEETYTYNIIFDQVSENSLSGLTTQFTLTNQSTNVTGVSTSNAIILVNDIFQQPSINYGNFDAYSNYILVEESGQTKIIFNESGNLNQSDINSSGLPRGGIIVSVGSTEGFGYQPLVAAGGTSVVSAAGTIKSISIGNSGSGYRVGIQTIINVGVQTFSDGIPNIEYVGYATILNGNIAGPVIITNPGSGYTTSNPPLVIFDSPLSYNNIPLVYSQTSSGVGTEAVVDIVVGQGSSVINFELKNLGYKYKIGDTLTVSIGGTVGIPTITGSNFKEFKVVVDRIHFDELFGWSIGDLQILDDVSKYFDGNTKIFPILINGNRTAIKARKGSNVDVEQTILLFINDILQVPGEAYHFKGGSLITLTEAPKPDDTIKLLFYRGTSSVDTIDIDVIETVKPGDTLNIESSIKKYDEDDRLALDVIATDIVKTNLYAGPGINSDPQYERSVLWCKQTEDKVINGKKIAKDRVNYEPLIEPTTNIIQTIGTGSTEIFVQSLKTFFDNASEYNELIENASAQKKITIISQDPLVGAYATTTVSSAGTITSINIVDGGVGYTTNPVVKISNPLGYGVTVGFGSTAILQSTISIAGTVSSINIISAGFGYTYTNPPLVLIESPTVKIETSENVSYEGDYGIIVGIATTSIVGLASTALVFDLYIPNNSPLTNSKFNSSPTVVSGIKTGYYFEVFESNVGKGHTSLRSNGSIVSVGSSFVNNVYQVISTKIVTTFIPSVGISSINKVTVSLSSYNNYSFTFDKLIYFDSDLITFDSIKITFDYNIVPTRSYGNYSWGKINTRSRKNPKEFEFYNNGSLGITTSAVVKRTIPLKYKNYT
jgi:hypothetical protein